MSIVDVEVHYSIRRRKTINDCTIVVYLLVIRLKESDPSHGDDRYMERALKSSLYCYFILALYMAELWWCVGAVDDVNF